MKRELLSAEPLPEHYRQWIKLRLEVDIEIRPNRHPLDYGYDATGLNGAIKALRGRPELVAVHAGYGRSNELPGRRGVRLRGRLRGRRGGRGARQFGIRRPIRAEWRLP